MELADIMVGQRKFRSEADIGAEFVHHIRTDGRLDIVLEVKLPSAHHKSGAFRVDAVILNNGHIVCAVEFKKPAVQIKHQVGRQKKAYDDLPFPHFYVIGRRGIKRILPLVFACAGFEIPAGTRMVRLGPVNEFGKSSISRTGRIKGTPMVATALIH